MLPEKHLKLAIPIYTDEEVKEHPGLVVRTKFWNTLATAVESPTFEPVALAKELSRLFPPNQTDDLLSSLMMMYFEGYLWVFWEAFAQLIWAHPFFFLQIRAQKFTYCCLVSSTQSNINQFNHQDRKMCMNAAVKMQTHLVATRSCSRVWATLLSNKAEHGNYHTFMEANFSKLWWTTVRAVKANPCRLYLTIIISGALSFSVIQAQSFFGSRYVFFNTISKCPYQEMKTSTPIPARCTFTQQSVFQRIIGGVGFAWRTKG